MFPLYACEPTWKNINMWRGRRRLRWTREVLHVGARCWMEKKRRIWYYVVRRSVVWLFCVSVKQKNKVDFLSPRQERVSFEHFKKVIRRFTLVTLFDNCDSFLLSVAPSHWGHLFSTMSLCPSPITPSNLWFYLPFEDVTNSRIFFRLFLNGDK